MPENILRSPFKFWIIKYPLTEKCNHSLPDKVFLQDHFYQIFKDYSILSMQHRESLRLHKKWKEICLSWLSKRFQVKHQLIKDFNETRAPFFGKPWNKSSIFYRFGRTNGCQRQSSSWKFNFKLQEPQLTATHFSNTKSSDSEIDSKNYSSGNKFMQRTESDAKKIIIQ